MDQPPKRDSLGRLLKEATITNLTVVRNEYDFSAMHEAIQQYVDGDLLAGAACVVLKDNEVADFNTWGFADIESKQPIQQDSIYRIYSNTKIITAVAAMCLHEDGAFALDDALETYLPQLANLQVIKADNTDDTEPALTKPTIRQVMSHSAGFSYGFLMESPVDALYNKVNIMDPSSTLADMIDKLAELPLAYQPGTRWQYSVSADILARLVEVWSGQTFIDFLKQRIFDPLDMVDTDFYVPEKNHHRLTSNYAPVNPMAPMEGGLQPVPEPLTGGYLQPTAFLSGGGGLVSTIGDYTRFIQMLTGEGEHGGVRILRSETVTLMHANQLTEGIGVQLPNWFMPDTIFGIGLAIKTAPREGEPETAIDEFHWGGMAGTHSWIAPRAGLAGLIFTQRLPGFWHPFSHDFKRLVYQACTRRSRDQ